MDSRASGTGALVGVSTGSLARYPNGGDPVVLAGYLSDIEADAVEVLFYRGFHEDLERAARAFRGCGRPIKVVHAEKNLGTAFGSPDPAQVADGQRRFLEALWLAQQVGAQLVTLHLWDRPESDRNLERNFAALEPLLPRVQAAGMAVGLETIPCTVHNPVDNVRSALTHFGGLAAGCAVTLDLEFLGWHDCVERGVNGAFADLERSNALLPHNPPHELMEEVRKSIRWCWTCMCATTMVSRSPQKAVAAIWTLAKGSSTSRPSSARSWPTVSVALSCTKAHTRRSVRLGMSARSTRC